MGGIEIDARSERNSGAHQRQSHSYRFHLGFFDSSVTGKMPFHDPVPPPMIPLLTGLRIIWKFGF